MRKGSKWTLVVCGSLLAGEALLAHAVRATPQSGFSGGFDKGVFEEFAVRAQVVPQGLGGSEDDVWFAMQKTKGPSDLYVLRNVWDPAAVATGFPFPTTGWHSHPGYSLIIVTEGTITAYDGDDPSCTPHTYTAGTSATLIDANHVHLIRNESGAIARATVVQIVPAGATRRKDEPAPASCPGIQ